MGLKQKEDASEELGTAETEKEKATRVFKGNSEMLLHQRNTYVFFALVADETITLNFSKAEVLAYLLIKKLFFSLGSLKSSLEAAKNIFDLPMWQEYTKTKDYKKIFDYVLKEYHLFKEYIHNLEQSISKKAQEGARTLWQKRFLKRMRKKRLRSSSIRRPKSTYRMHLWSIRKHLLTRKRHGYIYVNC